MAINFLIQTRCSNFSSVPFVRYYFEGITRKRLPDRRNCELILNQS